MRYGLAPKMAHNLVRRILIYNPPKNASLINFADHVTVYDWLKNCIISHKIYNAFRVTFTLENIFHFSQCEKWKIFSKNTSFSYFKYKDNYTFKKRIFFIHKKKHHEFICNFFIKILNKINKKTRLYIIIKTSIASQILKLSWYLSSSILLTAC
jgi:hypothetical protein